MNILLITNDFYPNTGGVAHVLMNLCKSLRKSGHNLYVFNPYTNGKKIFKLISFLETYTFKDLLYSIRKKKFISIALISFWKIIRDKKIPLSHKFKIILFYLRKPRILLWVVENMIRIYPFLEKLSYDIILGGSSDILPLILVISRIFKKKVMTIAYGDDFLIQHRLSYKTSFYKSLDVVVVICNQMKKMIKRIHNLSNDNVEIINVGINLSDLNIKDSKKDLRNKFKIPENQYVLISVGRHIPRKSFDLVIKALSEIKKIRPSLNIKYYLIGEGHETAYLKNLTRELNLEKEVEFLGSADVELRNKYYKVSDVFIMPSVPKKNSIEGFGIVFLEANYYKIPCIGSYSGGVIDAIVNDETGFLIKPNDLNDLVNKILFLYDNEDIRIEMGEKGYQRAINEFTWENIVKNYIRVFKKII